MALNTLYDKRKRKDVVEVVYHGIPYAEFDKTGHWSTWSLVRMFEGSLMLSASLSPCAQTVTSHEEDYILLRQHCEISPRYYQDITIQSKFNPRIMFGCQEVGRTSLNIKVRMFNQHTEYVYATNMRKMVNFNKRTKKAVPNNPFYLEQAEGLNGMRPKYSWPPFPDNVPSKVFRKKVFPLHSDTDFMNHVNNSSYIRFCLDCCACAAEAKFYNYFEADFHYPVLEVDIQYLGESFANETLDISTWQSETDICDFYFIITHKHKVIAKTFLRLGLTKLKKITYADSKL